MPTTTFELLLLQISVVIELKIPPLNLNHWFIHTHWPRPQDEKTVQISSKGSSDERPKTIMFRDRQSTKSKKEVTGNVFVCCCHTSTHSRDGSRRERSFAGIIFIGHAHFRSTTLVLISIYHVTKEELI